MVLEPSSRDGWHIFITGALVVCVILHVYSVLLLSMLCIAMLWPLLCNHHCFELTYDMSLTARVCYANVYCHVPAVSVGAAVVVVVVAGAAASLLAITVGITTSDTVRPEVVQVDQHLEIASVGVAVDSVITVVVVVVEDGDSMTPVRGRTARPDSTCPWCTEDVCFDAEAMC